MVIMRVRDKKDEGFERWGSGVGGSMGRRGRGSGHGRVCIGGMGVGA